MGSKSLVVVIYVRFVSGWPRINVLPVMIVAIAIGYLSTPPSSSDETEKVHSCVPFALYGGKRMATKHRLSVFQITNKRIAQIG